MELYHSERELRVAPIVEREAVEIQPGNDHVARRMKGIRDESRPFAAKQ